MTEVWKDIIGYEGRYMISNLGRVKSLSREVSNGKGVRKIDEKIITPYTDELGYKKVSLKKDNKGKTSKVHRLVAIAFIPNPMNLPQVNHKDENPSNNNVDNLEWCDAKYNVNYGNHNKKLSKALMGRKLDKKQVEKMSKMFNGGGNPRAQKVICNGKTYGCVKDLAKEIGIDNSLLMKYIKGKRKSPEWIKKLNIQLINEESRENNE